MFKKNNLKAFGKIKSFNIDNNITNLVQDFYTKKPFPNYDNLESKQSIVNKGDANHLTHSLKTHIGLNKNFLEVGSGTCQLSNYLAVGTNNNIYALDPTLESLKLGENFANNNNIQNVNFINADLFDSIFNDNTFDFVWCSGVLHHTKNPKLGFETISKYVKKDGYILIGLYNKYGRFRTHFRQFIYKNISKRLAILLDPFLRSLGSNAQEKKDAWIQDQYQHPVESTHSYDEVLDWFSNEGFDFVNAIPSIFLDDNQNYFEKINKGNKFERLFEQIYMIFTKLGGEGGLYIMIGQKK